MTTEKSNYSKELIEIQTALIAAEESRFAEKLTAEQRSELERASIVLRNRERQLLALISKEIASKIKTSGSQLKEIAKEMRTRSTKLGKTAHSITSIKKAIRLINKMVEQK